ncbi:helix-turn-helix domain-containing protein [Thiomicrorhabdus indica]|uniref:helix-turn-helix domain-containing protein n=1 Tax=Thiomicrorhabdus indica TaxID=2267253 RepID=UPI00102DC78A|nr:helix-turn-helix transcriptional regulator [Thiomicrorhabdus indica]
MFQFNDYLRICREHQNLTQSELVTALCVYDKTFESLDTNTLSRWERGVSKPSLSKQTLLVHYFSESFDRIYPFIEQAERIEIEKSFCAIGFSKMLGRHKLVMSFPCQHMDKSRFLIKLIQDSHLKQSAISKNLLIFQEMYNLPLSSDTLQKMANIPSNHFSVCEYDSEYYGHFFALKLKPSVFEQAMNFLIDFNQLSENDIAKEDELGNYLFFGFFGMSDIVISILWVHFYSWVIKQQSHILEMGAIITSKEGEMIAKNMNTEKYASLESKNRHYQSFRATTKQMLITDNVVKMLFNPESCPEN